MFAQYHYLSHYFNKSAKVFLMTVNDKIAGFSSAIYQPHPKIKNIYREHRTVLLPDFQGIGLGNFLSDFVAFYYTSRGFRYRSVTSNPAMIFYRKKSKHWRLVHKGRKMRGKGIINSKSFSGKERITTSWEFVLTKEIKEKFKDTKFFE